MVVKAIEICEVAGLVDFVDIGFFRREGDASADFVADFAEEGVVEEILDYAVFVS